MALWKKRFVDPISGLAFTKGDWSREQQFRDDYWSFVRTGRLEGTMVGPKDVPPEVWAGYKAKMGAWMLLSSLPELVESDDLAAWIRLLSDGMTDHELRTMMSSVPKDRRSDPPAPDFKVLADKLARLEHLPKGWDTKERHDWRISQRLDAYARAIELAELAGEAARDDPEDDDALYAYVMMSGALEEVIGEETGTKCGEPDCPHCEQPPDTTGSAIPLLAELVADDPAEEGS